MAICCPAKAANRSGLTQALAPHLMKTAALIVLLLVSFNATAQGLPPLAVREINQLFTVLQSSKCEFYRNGTWHNSKRATEHLQSKYNYLVKRKLVTSTEGFIDLAASKSSSSGKPYLVRCGNTQPVPGKAWFMRKLKELRGRPAGANNSFNPMPLRGTG